MSHAKERKEKNCLNCNAAVAGRFCQVCGQENIETHETFGHLAGHFIGDIFHFDGQFLSTVKYLLFKPGFLTQEYVRGRRVSYLNPIKMYFFVSAVFFLLFLSFFQDKGPVKIEEQKNITTAQLIAKLEKDTAEIKEKLGRYKATSYTGKMFQKKLAEREEAIQMLKRDSAQKEEIDNRLEGPTFFGGKAFDSRVQYDSAQADLPPAERDNWIEGIVARRNIELSQKFNKNPDEATHELQENVYHHIPQTLFISLPVFALLLQLLYARHKNLYYANHAIFTLHLYCALFIFIFLNLVLGMAAELPYLSWLGWVSYGVILYTIYYTFRALRVFYGQGWGKTLVKWIGLSLMALIVMVVLEIIMVMFSIVTL